MKQMRDRLIELLDECRSIEGVGSDLIEKQADFLLVNGVIVLPCKVGDTVYSCVGNAYRLEKIVIESCSKNATLVLKSGLNGQLIFDENDIGKTVFLTPKEAEQALKGERT